jgi:hypothetical protein
MHSGTEPSVATLALATNAAGLNLELLGNQTDCTLEEYGEALDLITTKLLAYAQ